MEATSSLDRDPESNPLVVVPASNHNIMPSNSKIPLPIHAKFAGISFSIHDKHSG